jgi:hypothetical protein
VQLAQGLLIYLGRPYMGLPTRSASWNLCLHLHGVLVHGSCLSSQRGGSGLARAHLTVHRSAARHAPMQHTWRGDMRLSGCLLMYVLCEVGESCCKLSMSGLPP